MVLLHDEKSQRILRQTTLSLRYPIYAQCLPCANQTDPHRPMLEHERFDVTQQLPQLLKPHLRILVHTHEFTLSERKLLDRRERATFVKGVINMRCLREV